MVIDLDGNGSIDSGTELFGNYTMANGRLAEHGFAALVPLDSNSDNVIDSNDADWSKLRVYRWTDSDNDGFFDEGEGRLETLAQHGVSSLGLTYRSSTTVDSHGNEHRQVGSYTKSDRTVGKMVDVWFETAPGLSKNVGTVVPVHSETIAGLPDVGGGGLVHDLRDAMALDKAGRLTPPLYGPGRAEQRTLEQLVAAFGTATAGSTQDELLEKILHRWAGAEGVRVGDYVGGSHLVYTTPQKFAVVEAFRGGKWREGMSYRRPALSTAQKIEFIYLSISEGLRANLLRQTSLNDMFSAISVLYDGEAVTSETDLSDAELSDFAWDFSGVLGVENAASRKGDFLRSLAALTIPTPDIISALRSANAAWAYEYRYHSDYLAGMVSDGITQRANEFWGDDTANTFRTTDGGIDHLRGAGGSDIYQLGRGTGHDVVEEDFRGNNGGAAATDIVKVAPGIARSNVVVGRTLRDLVISIVDSEGQATDSLCVKDHYVKANARIERLELGDGTTYTLDDLAALPLSKGDGTKGADHYDATVLPGSLGESQRGGKGSDTYVLGRGTGHESIDESHLNHAGSDGDVIRLKAGLVLANVKLSRHGSDLKVGLVGSDGVLTDSLTIKGHYRGVASKVEFLESSDGTRLLDLLVAQSGVRLQNGASGGIIDGAGRGTADTFGMDAGSDTFRGRSGNDVYELGLGSGTDHVEEGFHNHVAGDGADTIRLGAGVTSSMARMRRTMWDLVVELVDSEGAVTDSLTVRDQFRHGWAKVERVVLDDGSALWSSSDIDALTFTGPTYRQSNNTLRGTSSGGNLIGGVAVNDVFDSDAGGNDRLYGLQGDDEYRLGRGTGTDEVRESHSWLGGHEVQAYGAGDAGDLIKIESGIGTGDVRLRRDDRHLWVELLGAAGEDGVRPVTDSLKVVSYFERDVAKVETVEFSDGTVWDSGDFHAVALRGGTGADIIKGRDDLVDIFDSDGGGNDKLYGLQGDDEYRLGSGTGADEVRESHRFQGGPEVQAYGDGDAGDLIRVESGFGTGDVRLRRDDRHLWVELLGTAGEDGVRPVTDSLKVVDYFERDVAKVETVEFADGTVWDSGDFHAVALRGGAGADVIKGRDDLDDIFDSDGGGNDKLYGLQGDDEYRLGSGTGTDEVRESHRFQGGPEVQAYGDGDAGDLIRVESGFGTGDVRLRRDDRHLWVELLGTAGEDGVRPVTDSLKVVSYFERDVAKVETVEFADGTVWDSGDFHAVALRGGAGADIIKGRDDLDDIFDSDGGGNDKLYGLQGDDEYRLGSGTGVDEVRESHRFQGGPEVQAYGDGDAGDLIRVESGFGTGDVRLRRDDRHLWVELLGTAGEGGVRPVTDSLKVVDYFERDVAKVETVEFADGTVWDSDDFHAVALRGGVGADIIKGRDDLDDIFDSDGGGNDKLYGLQGDDEYRLGIGTGADEVRESHTFVGGVEGKAYGNGDSGDLIRVDAGISPSDVRLRRDQYHLWVELLGTADENGERPVTDSLKVVDYYERVVAKVETVEFSDGTVWDTSDFDVVPLRGGAGDDEIHGRADFDDVFDSDAGGNDNLYGEVGDDEYRLGSGTGMDTIDESSYNRGDGDDGDLIRVESGHGVGDVRLRRDGNHLLVELFGTAGEDGPRSVTDSLKVKNYYVREVYKVETVKFADGTEWGGDFVVGTTQSDTVTSTTASETLHGGQGDDTYVVSREFGDDRVVDSGGTDKVQMSGHTSSTLSFAREGDDMIMEVVGSDDRVTFDNWYADSNSRKVERIEAGDKVLLSTAAERMATAMATFVSGGGTASDFVSRNHQDYWETMSGTPGG